MPEAQVEVKPPPTRRGLLQAKRALLVRLVVDLAEDHQSEWQGTAAKLLLRFVQDVDPGDFELLPASPHGLVITMRSLHADLLAEDVLIDFHFGRDRSGASILRIRKAGRSHLRTAMDEALSRLEAEGG